MKYSKLLKFLLAPFFMYGVEEDAAADRGDNFVPVDDKVDDTKVELTDEEKDEAKEIAEAIAAAKEDKVKKEAEAKAAAGKTDAEKAAEEKEKKSKDTRIPLARHEAVLKRERESREAVELELSKYKQGKEIAATNEEITAAETKLGTLEAEYNKHMADGQVDKATATMKEIRLAERGISDKKMQMNVAAAEARAEARAVERVRFDTTVDRLEEAYTQIRPGHEDYDKDVVAEMLEMQSAYVAKGYPPSQALQKAVGYILKPTTVKQEKAVNVEAKVSEEDKAKAAREARKAAAVAKALEAEGKTPPDASKIGKDHDKAGGGQVDGKAVMKMNQADFAKLDEAALSKLRGDDL